MIHSQSGEAFIIPNAFEKDYFRLAEGNHVIEENGNILLKNVRIFTLNHQSDWTRNFYPASAPALNAVHNWCKKGPRGVLMGEYGHPNLDGPLFGSEERAGRFATFDETRRAVNYLNTRMLFEVDGDPCLPGPWIVTDVVIPVSSPYGELLATYLKEGGFFRFALRSSTGDDWTQMNLIHKHIKCLVTFDIITKEMDDAVQAEIDKREAERVAQNKLDAEDPSLNAPLDSPEKPVVSDRVKALVSRALPVGFDKTLGDHEGDQLEKHDGE